MEAIGEDASRNHISKFKANVTTPALVGYDHRRRIQNKTLEVHPDEPGGSNETFWEVKDKSEKVDF